MSRTAGPGWNGGFPSGSPISQEVAVVPHETSVEAPASRVLCVTNAVTVAVSGSVHEIVPLITSSCALRSMRRIDRRSSEIGERGAGNRDEQDERKTEADR